MAPRASISKNDGAETAALPTGAAKPELATAPKSGAEEWRRRVAPKSGDERGRAGGRIRTDGLLITNQLLCQLSYSGAASKATRAKARDRRARDRCCRAHVQRRDVPAHRNAGDDVAALARET